MTLKDLAFVIFQVLLLLVFVAVPGGFAASLLIQVIAFIMVTGGIILVLVAMVYLGPGLTPSPRPREHSKLITTGIYKYLRHPVYSGIILTLGGISLYSLNLPRTAITLLVIILFYYKSEYEEQLLSHRFPGYSAYRNRTGRFFPALRRKKTG